MNKKIYSLVWNNSLKQIVVASELAPLRVVASSDATTICLRELFQTRL